MEIVKWVIDAIFPKYCFGCGKEGIWVCDACLKTIHVYRQKKYTGDCAEMPVSFLFSAYSYTHPLIRNMVHALKYEYIVELGDMMGALLACAYREYEYGIVSDAYVIPIPIHKKRLRERGFNQSEYISRSFAQCMQLFFTNSILERVVYTQSQVHLSRSERIQNVTGAFRVLDKEKIQGKTVYLIDDVYTTGATLMEAAWILQTAGAKNIIGLTFAREE